MNVVLCRHAAFIYSIRQAFQLSMILAIAIPDSVHCKAVTEVSPATSFTHKHPACVACNQHATNKQAPEGKSVSVSVASTKCPWQWILQHSGVAMKCCRYDDLCSFRCFTSWPRPTLMHQDRQQWRGALSTSFLQSHPGQESTQQMPPASINIIM